MNAARRPGRRILCQNEKRQMWLLVKVLRLSPAGPIELSRATHSVQLFMWPRWDSNPHRLPRSILSRVRLPFRHLAMRC